MWAQGRETGLCWAVKQRQAQAKYTAAVTSFDPLHKRKLRLSQVEWFAQYPAAGKGLKIEDYTQVCLILKWVLFSPCLGVPDRPWHGGLWQTHRDEAE